MKSNLSCLVLASILFAVCPLAHGGDLGKSGELMLTGPNSNVVQKAKITGSNLMLLGSNGKWLKAPDGSYAEADGRKIIVVNGSIKEDAPPLMDGGSKETDSKKKNVPPHSGELMLIGPNSNVVQKAKISGSNLMLLGSNGKWLKAPDGSYTAADGRKIIVVNGSIKKDAPPLMDGGSKETDSKKKNVPPPKEGTAEGALRRALKGKDAE